MNNRGIKANNEKIADLSLEYLSFSNMYKVYLMIQKEIFLNLKSYFITILKVLNLNI